MPAGRPIVLRAGEGRGYALGADSSLVFKADGDAYSIAVATARPNDPGTTPHVHSEHDDMSFVIEGALTYEIAGETHEAPAGTFVLVPRGATHRWWNPHPEPATFLNVHIAGHGFESFIQELSALSAAGHATREAMAELGERHDVYFEFSGVNTPSS